MYTYVWYIVPEHWRMISWTKRIYALLSQKGKSYDMLNSIHFIGCNFALIPLAWREKEAIYLKWKQKLWEIQTFTVTITWSPFNYYLLHSYNNLTSKKQLAVAYQDAFPIQALRPRHSALAFPYWTVNSIAINSFRMVCLLMKYTHI